MEAISYLIIQIKFNKQITIAVILKEKAGSTLPGGLAFCQCGQSNFIFENERSFKIKIFIAISIRLCHIIERSTSSLDYKNHRKSRSLKKNLRRFCPNCVQNTFHKRHSDDLEPWNFVFSVIYKKAFEKVDIQ